MSYDRSPRPVCSTTYGIRMLLMFQIYSALFIWSSRIVSIDLCDRVFKVGDCASAAQHRDNFVDSRTHSAAGQRDSNRLRQLPKLHVEATEDVFEDSLN